MSRAPKFCVEFYNTKTLHFINWMEDYLTFSKTVLKQLTEKASNQVCINSQETVSTKICAIYHF